MTTPRDYERGLAPIIKFNEHKRIIDPPLDLQCSPYRDDPDHADKLALKELQAAGVVDAGKQSKKSVQYSRAKGPDQCHVCANWDGPQAELAACKIVGGAIRFDRWCARFIKGADHGPELDQGSDQATGPAAPGPGGAAGAEDPSGEAGAGGPLGQSIGAPPGEPR